MLIAGGGGGYGGTHWMAKEVPAMWAAVANQDTESHFEVVGGWSKTADLTLAHLAQVQVYRDNLASVWPPSKSPAAAAYLARLDKLMVDLQATHDAASANYTAFSTVTLTLSLARQKLKALYEKYESNAKQNFVWQQKQDAAAATNTPTPTPSPSPTPKTPPVSSAQQEELNRQARVIMYDLSSTVLSGHAALQKPKPYDPRSGTIFEDEDGNANSGGASGFAVPPVIPPPGGGFGANSGSTHNSPPTTTVTPASSPTNVPAGTNVPGVGSGGGPILGGTGPTPVITLPSPGPLPVPSPNPLPSPTPPGLLPPGIIGPGLTPPGGFLPQGVSPPAVGLTKPGMSTLPGGRMTMPSGGVIGATPGSGMIGQMPANSHAGRAGGAVRANPVGGIIGSQGISPSQRGGNRSAGAQLGQPVGRRRSQQDTEADTDRWDPDNPWATEEGVDPILLPPQAPGPIDPGPAIGYSR